MAKSSKDWEKIEREYRAGQLSIAEIARQKNISRQAIMKRAKKHNWARDLTELVRNQINAKLVTEVTACNTQDAVNIAASRGVAVVRLHQKLLSRLLSIAENFMDEIETSEKEIKPEKKISHRDKSDMFRSLGQVLAKAIPLERQAFNLDDHSGVPIESILIGLPASFAAEVRSALAESLSGK